VLLNSVILVLREVLEAAILVSVLLALSFNLRLGLRWLWCSLPPALVGAFWFAYALDDITDALDGAGQEVVNAGLQILVYLLTLGIVALVVGLAASPHGTKRRALQVLMGVAVSCALVREGSEIVVYITGFASAQELRASIFTGAAIGAGIGVSLGILLSAALRAQSPEICKRTSLVLLCLIGAGMVMQASMLLEQVDWLPAGHALWDSSALLSERSIPGELMYAVFGYEATPSAVQLSLYLASLLAMAATWFVAGLFGKSDYAN
jgi:high-affinity iron transporter